MLGYIGANLDAGRAWTYQELSVKSFEDLHKLYWVCVKEQNQTLTREKERTRVRAGYGALESQERVEAVRQADPVRTLTPFRCILSRRMSAPGRLEPELWAVNPRATCSFCD